MMQNWHEFVCIWTFIRRTLGTPQNPQCACCCPQGMELYTNVSPMLKLILFLQEALIALFINSLKKGEIRTKQNGSLHTCKFRWLVNTSKCVCACVRVYVPKRNTTPRRHVASTTKRSAWSHFLPGPLPLFWSMIVRLITVFRSTHQPKPHKKAWLHRRGMAMLMVHETTGPLHWFPLANNF